MNPSSSRLHLPSARIAGYTTLWFSIYYLKGTISLSLRSTIVPSAAENVGNLKVVWLLLLSDP